MKNYNPFKSKAKCFSSFRLSNLMVLLSFCFGLSLFPLNTSQAQCTATGAQKIISGRVYNDINDNGADDSEGGIAGVDILIYADSDQDGVVDNGEPLIGTATTDVNGDYSFTFTQDSKNIAEDFSGSVFSGTNNNSGTDNWANDFWIRDGGNGNTGDVSAGNFSGGGYEFGGTEPVLQLKDNAAGAYRVVNLSGASSAFLNFSYDVHNNVEGDDEGFVVEVSTNEGLSYTTVYSYFNTDGNSPSPVVTVSNLDLSAFITLPASATTRIRFITNFAPANNEDFWFDDISLEIAEDIDDFVIEADVTTFPTYYWLSTDNVETAVIASGGNCDTGNDFGLYLPDNDGDGVGDIVDLDDDNDGILDVDEGMMIIPGTYGTELVDDADAIFEVTPNTNAAQLASYLFVPNSGVTVSAESINQGDGSVNQIGTFDDADQITDSGGATQAFANFSTGLIFSTGNLDIFDDSLSNRFYDPDGLGNLVSAGGGTDPDFDGGYGEADVASLSFTANVSNVSTISGRFVFASEEYLEYVGNVFNDNVRILVNGVDQALTPGGAVISINTINNFTESAYFIDNETDPTAVNIEADGFTTVLNFSTTLRPGDNTIKIGIADAFDDEFDSWLFFEANSFEIISQDVTGVDTDGDLIFDHLDNDSDNDTCPDAVEGAGSITTAQVNGLGQITGGQDTDGVPNLVSGGQATLADVRDDSVLTQCGAAACGTVKTNRHIGISISR